MKPYPPSCAPAVEQRRDAAPVLTRPPLPRLDDLAQFAALLDRQLGQCRRLGVRASVLLVEIDPKGLDERAAGLATLLQAVAARLATRVRGSDVLAQVGERRFGVVLIEAGRTEAEIVRARLHGALCGPYGVEERRLYVTLSTGLAVYRESGMTGRELSQAAEAALQGVEDRSRTAVPPSPLSLVKP